MRLSRINPPRTTPVSKTKFHLRRRLVPATVCALFLGVSAFAKTPAIGAKAPDFTPSTPTGKAVKMSKEEGGHSLVLAVLRGFPGYQCPYCVKQVHDFIDHASDFEAKKTRVLLVYPGPPAALDQHAKEFLEKQAELPSNIVLVTDPEDTVTNLYGLRWTLPMRPHTLRPSFSTRKA